MCAGRDTRARARDTVSAGSVSYLSDPPSSETNGPTSAASPCVSVSTIPRPSSRPSRAVHSRPGAVGAHPALDQADVAAQAPHRAALAPGISPGAGWPTTGEASGSSSCAVCCLTTPTRQVGEEDADVPVAVLQTGADDFGHVGHVDRLVRHQGRRHGVRPPADAPGDAAAQILRQAGRGPGRSRKAGPGLRPGRAAGSCRSCPRRAASYTLVLPPGMPR